MYIYCKKPHSLLPPHVGGKGAGGVRGEGGRGEKRHFVRERWGQMRERERGEMGYAS